MVGNLLAKVFGTQNDRDLKRLRPFVARIGEIEPSMRPLSDDDLREKTAVFKPRVVGGESLDDLLPEAFALVKAACKSLVGTSWNVCGIPITWEMVPYDVQIVGGIVLHQGKIAEMATGEGKTLVATMPLYLNALAGKGVHLVTVNDYLARRDGEWMGQIYQFLGMSVGIIQHDMRPAERRAAYLCDITRDRPRSASPAQPLRQRYRPATPGDYSRRPDVAGL